mmetsp:Transcript_107002/g.185008  ORF Transcript_107002/g.185008 Transcript_107002/m.185008 type:complete len:707 (-) Transcript_107002:89-2209(-)
MHLASSLSLCLWWGIGLVAVGATVPEATVCVNNNCSDVEDGGSFFLQTRSNAVRANEVDGDTSRADPVKGKFKDPFEADLKDLGMPTLSSASGTNALTRRDGVTTVKEFDCMKHGRPIQVLKDGKTGFAFKELNVETGVYESVFSVPFSRVTPAYQDLNSCGINPVDGIAYCTMWQNEQYIVRVDEDTIEYVAKIPGAGKSGYYNTGSFSPGGVYYVATGEAKFFVLANISSMKGFPSQKASGLPNFEARRTHSPQGFDSAADVVVVRDSLEGSKVGAKEYAIVLNKGSLMIAKFEGGEFTKTWNMAYKMPNGKLGGKEDTWGAGWNFNGKVFFAINDGKGVYQIDMKKLRYSYLSKDKKEYRPFPLKKIGASAAGGFNDGINCMSSPDPWVTSCLPFPCKVHKGPLQIIRQEGPWYEKEEAQGRGIFTGYGLKKLDLLTGTYTEIWTIPFTQTKPKFKYLNAVGISPIDGIAYGCLLFNEYPGDFYIVRFDQTQRIEFLAKMEGPYDPVAGAFDSKGNFFFVHNTKGSFNPVLFQAPEKLDSMKGYPNQTGVPLLTNLTGLTLWKSWHFADIVAVSYDLEGTGKSTEYILAINRERQAVMVKWNKEDPSSSVVHRFATNNPFPETGFMSYGAAWNFKDRVFFSSNDGFGVAETKKIDLARKTITFAKVGKSSKVMNNDGFNCWGQESPFEGAPDPRVKVVSGFKS